MTHRTHDWAELRLKYASARPPLSVKAFAEQEGISRTLVSQHARDDHWDRAREVFEARARPAVERQVAAMVVRDQVKEQVAIMRAEAAINRRQHRIAGKLTRLAEKGVDGLAAAIKPRTHPDGSPVLGRDGQPLQPEPLDPRQVKAFAESLQLSVEQERISGGYGPTPTRVEHSIAVTDEQRVERARALAAEIRARMGAGREITIARVEDSDSE